MAGEDKALLFGGKVSGSANDETWVYDLSDNTWTQKNPSTKPSVRYYIIKTTKEVIVMKKIALLFIPLFCWLPISSLAQSWSKNFDDGKANDWVVVTGNWQVDNKEYCQSEMGANRYSFYAVGEKSLVDYVFEVRIKPISGPYAGVIFRAMETGPGGPAPNWSKGHFYSWLIGTSGGIGYSKIWKALLGAEAMIEGTDGENLKIGEWNDVRVDVKGKNIEYYLNRKLQKRLDDNDNPILTGGVGLQAYDSQVCFDDATLNGPGDPGSSHSIHPKGKLALTWAKIKP